MKLSRSKRALILSAIFSSCLFGGVTDAWAADCENINTTLTSGVHSYTQDVLIDAEGVNGINVEDDLVLNAAGHNITVNESDNSGQTNAVQHMAAGKNLKISADTLVIRSNNPKARSEGIHLQGSNEGKAVMTVDGNLDITATNNAGNALGMYIQTGAELNVNGDVIMHQKDGWAVDSNNKGWAHYGASGIYATSAMGNSTGGVVNIAGDVDLKVNANGIFVNSGGARVAIEGGGSIEINKDTASGYSALRAEDGIINMNVKTNPDGTVKGASYHTVDIKGNIVAGTGAAHPNDVHGTMTQINLGLSGLSRTHSTLTGVIVNQFPAEGLNKGDKTFYGETNLWLDSDSVWNNEKWGKVSGKFNGSRVTNFHGATNADEIGYIFQNDAGAITIDNYSGMTKVIYKHELENPTAIIGGDLVINKAAAGSYIKLSTDGAGLNMGSIAAADRNKVSETLNALAGKLQYKAFASGEKNLRGEVEIAEGLTTSSAALKVGAIDFKEDSGQGQYTYTPAEEAPEHQAVDKFDTAITGNLDKAYVDNGVYKGEGKYVFEKDSVIEAAGLHGINAKNNILIDAEGHTLTIIENANDKEVHAIEGTVAGKNIVINADKLIVRAENPKVRTEGIRLVESSMTVNGDLDITATNNAGNAIGTYIQTGAELNINGNVIMHQKDGWAVDSNNGGWGYYGASGLYATSAMNDTTGATINVAGGLDMKVNANALFVNAGGAKINVKGGGSIEVNKDNTRGYAALRAENGIININVDAPEVITMSTAAPKLIPNNEDVNIKGNVAVTTGAVHPADVHGTLSQINLALNTKNSKLEGVIHNAFPLEGLDKSGIIFRGETNLWLANEAVWVNEKWGKIDKNFAGSRVTNFVGGSKEHLGYIYQKDAAAIEINNYSGAAKVIYAHNAANPTEILGGDIIINQAQADSYIKLSTDSLGLEAVAMDAGTDKIGETLQALAKKLQYNAYAEGERNLKGEVEIAEGLLTSSASLKVGNITFTDAGQGKYELGDDVVPSIPPTPPTPEDPEIIYGDEQTAMIRGAKSAMATSMLAWRGNMAGMYQRIGDLQSGEDTGVWARATGGKNNYENGKDKFNSSFKGIEVGADKEFGNAWRAGVAFDYMDGEADYALGGEGDPKLYNFSVYGTKKLADEQYIDIVAKVGRVENDYTVYNDNGYELNGDYDANGYSISVEYGKRFGDVQRYVEPQLQLSFGKLDSASYAAHSDYAGGRDMQVEQGSMNSILGRLGVTMGSSSAKGGYYLGANLLHEFDGELSSTFSAESEVAKTVEQDYGDTWAELTLGGNYNFSDNGLLYADVTRSFGGDYELEWKVNAGLRFSF